jgi:hypothetical protein
MENMGIEYTIHIQDHDAEAVAVVLRRWPYLHEVVAMSGDFEMRSAPRADGMPDARLVVEPQRIYFCANDGVGRDFLGQVIARLASHFGAVTIKEQ